MAFQLKQWKLAGRAARHRCAVRRQTFLHPILSDTDDDAPEFTCLDEDPVIVNVTDEERHQLELAI
jgi:hypothetical protein